MIGALFAALAHACSIYDASMIEPTPAEGGTGGAPERYDAATAASGILAPSNRRPFGTLLERLEDFGPR